MNSEIIPQTLRTLLEYDAERGDLTWRQRTPDQFSDGRRSAECSCRAWNSKHAGRGAFTARSCGYAVGAVLGVRLQAHRVIWAIMAGEWPADHIDHINGQRDDNRWCNLRVVSQAENQRNLKRPKNNSSGRVGVYRDKDRDCWRAAINVQGRQVHLGRFMEMGAAFEARAAAESKYGFHANHGRAQ